MNHFVRADALEPGERFVDPDDQRVRKIREVARRGYPIRQVELITEDGKVIRALGGKLYNVIAYS